MVLCFIDIQNIVVLCATCHQNAILTDSFLQRRRDRILRYFIPDVPAFMHFLKSSNAVISGSSALRLILAVADISWPISDLDIYILLSSGPSTTEFFHCFGYDIIPYPHPKTKYGCKKIWSVVAAVKGSQKIDIVLSCDGRPILPIFQFHSSIVMNYFTPTTIFSAYPALTLQFKGIINPMACTHHHMLPPRTMRALTKYVNRGFQFASSGLAWTCAENHTCTQTFDCPLHARTSFDSGCLNVSFSTPTCSSDIARCGSKEMYGWLLGGFYCQDLHYKFPPYVFYIPLSR
ncbi:uncharacterized protein EDB93DRAFT_1094604 [Suillus bovinus]|uniref:uncharacterized protein n=1 Tax=Suillus bovinus TaxID=48563 RepID=UPI001B85C0C2|nr:uncharacterized protein EDB93DRAFT_1094604 [Suillus bovinus]KAG2130954.1 hypothetical protein EDB93DRAFT_1094604 [Suillus bovinus]